MSTKGFKTIFSPSEALMRRLKLAQKFAVIAVVLIVPLVFVGNSYLSVQNHRRDFSAKDASASSPSVPWSTCSPRSARRGAQRRTDRPPRYPRSKRPPPGSKPH